MTPTVRRVTLSAAVLLAISIGCAARSPEYSGVKPAPATRADTGGLRRTLDSIADAHHGVVGYSVLDLDSGERISRRGDETFPTASLIKVSILVTVYDLVAKGQLSLDDPLTVLKIDQVPGSGIVQFLHNGAVLTVHDAAWLMATISDNTATNLLLDRIIIRRVWAKMDTLGLPHTRVHAKVYQRISSVAMDSSVKYGLGVTTPNEMSRLFELLARGKAVNQAADSAMLYILEHNTTDFMLQRFADGARAAHKDGEVDAARTECTLWYLSHRIVACVFTKENKDQRYVIDNEAQVSMARMGQAIITAFGGIPRPRWEIVARSQGAPCREPRRWREWGTGFDDDVRVRRQLDLGGIAGERLAVDPDLERRALGRLCRRRFTLREWLAPDLEEITERERAVGRRLDVDDSVGRVRVQPIDAGATLGLSDVARNGHLLAVIEDDQVLMDVDALPLLPIAGNAADGRGGRRSKLGRGRAREGDDTGGHNDQL